VSATEAERLGLFSRVVPDDRFAAEVTSLAADLAAKPPLPVRLAKQAVYASERHTLSHMLDVELDHQLQCFRTRDAAEGLAAFLAKRAPVFAGH
jgi:2-(1,2-epoxy-1,2-dihydrophenyl)acetyl-CoA isomerase